MKERILVTAEEKREMAKSYAAALGVDENYISTLVDTFYGRIREDEKLAPIFNGAIGDDWPEHLAKMKRFWSSVALNTGVYSGKPVPAHQKLEGVERDYFERWLSLFRATLEETAPDPRAVDLFMKPATRIAQSLMLFMFGVPGVPAR
ncbi:MAG: group III truncated hemoglobin [Parvularculaceae bacterium]